MSVCTDIARMGVVLWSKRVTSGSAVDSLNISEHILTHERCETGAEQRRDSCGDSGVVPG